MNRNMRKLRWAVLGTGKFATSVAIPATRPCLKAEIAGIASRSAQKAEAAARESRIAQVLLLLRGSARRPVYRCHLQRAAQSSACGMEHSRRACWQARSM